MGKRKKEDLKEARPKKKKEIPRSVEPEIVVLPGKKERILGMLIKIVKAVLRFLEKGLIRVRQKRLTRRMNGKK